MFESLNIHQPLLINSIGHSAGLLLFAVLLVLVLRDRRSYLPAIAASLALLWNAGSLAVLAGSSGLVRGSDLIATLSFAVLSLLPAVLLHLSLERGRWFIWSTGYAVSGIAVILHLAELATPDTRFHLAALWVIIAGFGLLSAAAMFATWQAGKRTAASMCLFLLAVSFVHFGPGHVRYAWSGEVALHHAGIPLALYVLLQDYRFILLDTFLRFVVNSVVACGFVILAIAVELPPQALDNPFIQGILFVSACLALAALIFVRGKLQLLLTRVVFRRPDREPVAKQIRQAGITAASERSFLETAGPLAAGFVGARQWEVRYADVAEKPAWVEACLPIRFAKGDSVFLLLGRREGGRRYLSEDLSELASLTAVTIEQVERMRNSEVQRLVSQAELRALQSQINPHFLFNSLNTLYGSIPRAASEARKMVLNLSEIFRYFLQSERTFIRLAEELQIVRAYLQIEAFRLGDRLQTEIVVDDAAQGALIPILSVQPLVENAVKHGIAARATPGMVRLHARSVDGGVRITVSDDGPGWDADHERRSGSSGVGLENVRQRLRLCFGEAAPLHINSSAKGTSVSFLVPAGIREMVPR